MTDAKESTAIPPDVSVKCRTCGEPYEERMSLIHRKMLWFPTCNHIAGKDSAEITPNV